LFRLALIWSHASFRIEFMETQFNYQIELKKELAIRQARNPLYSLRSFARDLGISATALSQVLSGKRDFSKNNAIKVADNLGFSPRERLSLFNSIKKKRDPFEDDNIDELTEDTFKFISQWYYVAILTYAEKKNCPSDPIFFSDKLGIKKKVVVAALERLVRLGYLKIENETLIRIPGDLRSSIDLPSEIFRRYHRQNFDLASQAMDYLPVEARAREVSSITFLANPESIERIKNLIVNFKRKVAKIAEEELIEEDAEVYTLGVQYFPAKNHRGDGNETTH